MARSTARFEDRKSAILQVASRIFAGEGYHQSSMRAIARGASSSLAGLYHYFPTKEEILYEISVRAFDTVIARAEADARAQVAPEERLRRFVRCHLGYFGTHLTEMKVLSHESESLSGEYRRRIQERKRNYVGLATEIVGRLPGAADRDLRVPVLALFGMMNWIYTWYRSPEDGDIELIAATMSDIFIGGLVRKNGSPPGDHAGHAELLASHFNRKG